MRTKQSGQRRCQGPRARRAPRTPTGGRRQAAPLRQAAILPSSGAPSASGPCLRPPAAAEAPGPAPDASQRASPEEREDGLSSARTRTAEGLCRGATRVAGDGGPPGHCGALRGEERARHRGEAQTAAHLNRHTSTQLPQPQLRFQQEQSGVCPRRRRRGGTHPDVAKGGPFEAGRARFRD